MKKLYLTIGLILLAGFAIAATIVPGPGSSGSVDFSTYSDGIVYVSSGSGTHYRGTSCTNSVVTALSTTGLPTCSYVTAASITSLPSHTHASSDVVSRVDAVAWIVTSTVTTIDVVIPYTATATTGYLSCMNTSTATVAFHSTATGASESWSALTGWSMTVSNATYSTDKTISSNTTITGGLRYRASAGGMSGGPCTYTLKVTRND